MAEREESHGWPIDSWLKDWGFGVLGLMHFVYVGQKEFDAIVTEMQSFDIIVLPHKYVEDVKVFSEFKTSRHWART